MTSALTPAVVLRLRDASRDVVAALHAAATATPNGCVGRDLDLLADALLPLLDAAQTVGTLEAIAGRAVCAQCGEPVGRLQRAAQREAVRP